MRNYVHDIYLLTDPSIFRTCTVVSAASQQARSCDHTHTRAPMHAHKLRTLPSSKLTRWETCQDYWRIEIKPLFTHRTKASPKGLTEYSLFHTHTHACTHHSDTKPVYCTHTPKINCRLGHNTHLSGLLFVFCSCTAATQTRGSLTVT
jgi:hypothetical protein